MENGSDWYYLVDGEDGARQEGPVASEVLVSLLAAGTLSQNTLVWREGMPDWGRIGAVADLAPGAQQEGGEPPAEPPPSEAASPEAAGDAAGAEEPSDQVAIRDFGAYNVSYSRSRKCLMIVTSDYHAQPLALTKLDLLGFLTAMEIEEQ